MLPWQQKGTPSALPVTTDLSLTSMQVAIGTPSFTGDILNNPAKVVDSTGGFLLNSSVGDDGDQLKVNTKGVEAQSVAFDINDLRLSNAVQKFLEANALGGTVYHQFCISHFGTAPRDETLNLPLYLGGTKAPVLISEVT